MSKPRIRAASFEKWLRANLDAGQLADLASHGADAGWPGLTYYRDTVALYDRYEEEIWTALGEDADDMGEPNSLALIAGFGGAKDVHDGDQLKNLLVWYMAERIAHRIADEREERKGR